MGSLASGENLSAHFFSHSRSCAFTAQPAKSQLITTTLHKTDLKTMADPLGTVMQVVEVVGKAIEIYKKIQDAPEQVRRIGKRMGILNTILGQLEILLRTDEKRALARLGPALTDQLLDVIEDIRKESEEVRILFVKWDKDIGPCQYHTPLLQFSVL